MSIYVMSIDGPSRTIAALQLLGRYWGIATSGCAGGRRVRLPMAHSGSGRLVIATEYWQGSWGDFEKQLRAGQSKFAKIAASGD
jgi:hypothetical protein